MKSLLEKLNITEVNSGASSGVDDWIENPSGKKLVSINPTTNEPIARVLQADAAAYDKVLSSAESAFKT